MQAAGLSSAFGPDFVGTVFAPTNEAFDKAAQMAQKLGVQLSLDTLKEILLYHVINGTVATAADLTDGEPLETLGGETLTVKLEGGKVYLLDKNNDEIEVVTPDVPAGDAIVHVIDGVLLPIALAPVVPPPAAAPTSGAASAVASLGALAASLVAAVLMA